MNSPQEQEVHLTKKDLASRWGVTEKSVERYKSKYGLLPVRFSGRQQFFDIAHVESMERRLQADKLKRHAALRGRRANIITVKEAKALARKGGAR